MKLCKDDKLIFLLDLKNIKPCAELRLHILKISISQCNSPVENGILMNLLVVIIIYYSWSYR